MIKTKKAFIIALAIPIVVLASLTTYKKYLYSFGEEVTLPIFGYDPRDLLAGHYLIYQIDYGVGELCPVKTEEAKAYVCLEPKLFTYAKPSSCQKLIEGVCQYGRFVAGIEKFFVPETKAKELEMEILKNKASIVLSVTASGKVVAKRLLIDGEAFE